VVDYLLLLLLLFLFTYFVFTYLLRTYLLAYLLLLTGRRWRDNRALSHTSSP